MEHLKFYNWLLNEEESAYVKKIKQLKNALGLPVQVEDEKGIIAAGNIILNDLEKENINNFKTNYMYTDVGVEENRKENQTAIDELLSSPNKKVSDLANLMVGLEKK